MRVIRLRVKSEKKKPSAETEGFYFTLNFELSNLDTVSEKQTVRVNSQLQTFKL